MACSVTVTAASPTVTDVISRYHPSSSPPRSTGTFLPCFHFLEKYLRQQCGIYLSDSRRPSRVKTALVISLICHFYIISDVMIGRPADADDHPLTDCW
ncbi:hypothetical protein J6590_017091 [Homalodisca vitripennis]|nr:hypothetical protein J6590_017091 [Homalodisca vitripennis]